jgi:hypothetical protein
MKKIMFAMALLGGIFFANSAHAQKKTKFYYYPDANVYYDVATSQYAYDSSGTWVYVNELPPTVTLSKNAKKVMVYHDTPDVWADNKAHVLKFKNGELKKDKTKSTNGKMQ